MFHDCLHVLADDRFFATVDAIQTAATANVLDPDLAGLLVDRDAIVIALVEAGFVTQSSEDDLAAERYRLRLAGTLPTPENARHLLGSSDRSLTLFPLCSTPMD